MSNTSVARLSDSNGGPVSIGKPIANTTFYVLDDNLDPVPVGVPGELFIGGNGVTRGYLHRPELTLERFVPNPFSPDTRLYRTGDMVRYRPDGNLIFLGRRDDQLKVRGHRIELGEIEFHAAQFPGVHEAVAVARTDDSDDTQIVVYVRRDDGATISTTDLKQALGNQLPDFMVPSHVVVLDHFPLTPNKKIDRNALPAPDHVAQAADNTYVAPTNDIEQTIAEIWKSALKLPQVGMQDNFFELGGHSLLVVNVHSRLRKDLGSDLTITDLFRFPTIRLLAAHLKHDGASDSADDAIQDRARKRQDALSRRRQRRKG